MLRFGLSILLLGGTLLSAADLPPAPTKPGFPRFTVQQIATDLTIGYAVIVTDINGDQKPDIVAVDQHRVVWYENPTWAVHTIIKGKTKPDNVCITAMDIDGDGKPELVLGAAWKPFDTANPGTLQWLKRGANLDDEWTMYPIPCEEPTVHRIRAIDLDGDGKPELVNVPLMGRDGTAKANWADGRPVRITAYSIPKEPENPANWKPTVVNGDLRVVHNFAPATLPGKPKGIIAASYEGVTLLTPAGSGWTAQHIGAGNQANPKSNRGASEIKMGSLGKDKPVIATIEPWHGNQVVTYTPPANGATLWTRHVVDEQLRWGHAVSFGDLDGDGIDELVIGVRDDPNPAQGDKFTEKRGVRIYRSGDGAKWDRLILEDGGVAVEDLAVADLNGDGKLDIVAVGRATHNARIYWNQGK